MVWVSAFLRYLNIMILIAAPYLAAMICHDMGFMAIPAGNFAATVAGITIGIAATVFCGVIGLLFAIYDRLNEISLTLAKHEIKENLADIDHMLKDNS